MNWDEITDMLDAYFADIPEPTDEELADLEAELEAEMWDEFSDEELDRFAGEALQVRDWLTFEMAWGEMWKREQGKDE